METIFNTNRTGIEGLKWGSFFSPDVPALEKHLQSQSGVPPSVCLTNLLVGAGLDPGLGRTEDLDARD